jgi:hypothetical protein
MAEKALNRERYIHVQYISNDFPEIRWQVNRALGPDGTQTRQTRVPAYSEA